MVNTILAVVLRLLRLVRVDDSHIGSATALGVLNDGTRSLARRAVLAVRSIRHGIVEFQIAVELGGDLELPDRRLLNTLALVTADLGAVALVRGSLASDALGLEASSSDVIPLAELLRARVARVLETLVAVEATEVEIAPVETLCHI
jgi:hypothetical protein